MLEKKSPLTDEDLHRINTFLQEKGIDTASLDLSKTFIKGDNGHLYYKEKKLGKGSFGAVTQCTDISTGEQCVIKKQKIDLSKPEERGEIYSITQERNMLKELSEYYGSRAKVSEKDKSLVIYTIMTLYEGSDFRHYEEQYMKDFNAYQKQALSFDEKLEFLSFATRVGQTFTEDLQNRVHSKNIIHRDLHAGNLLIQKDGTITIIDFGRAANLDPKTQTAAGKPYEAGIDGLWSPELKKAYYANKSYVFSKTDDIYGLGKTCQDVFKMLDILEMVMEDKELLERLNLSKTEVVKLYGLVEKLTAKDRNKRPSLSEVSAAFAKFNEKIMIAQGLKEQSSFSMKESRSQSAPVLDGGQGGYPSSNPSKLSQSDSVLDSGQGGYPSSNPSQSAPISRRKSITPSHELSRNKAKAKVEVKESLKSEEVPKTPKKK